MKPGARTAPAGVDHPGGVGAITVPSITTVRVEDADTYHNDPAGRGSIVRGEGFRRHALPVSLRESSRAFPIATSSALWRGPPLFGQPPNRGEKVWS